MVRPPAGDWWERVEYGNFNLADFRWHAAALVKYLIRAREKADPGFLGSLEAYRLWDLANIADDRESQIDLLKKAGACARLVWEDMVAMGGSGGVACDDPLAELKSMIAGYAHEQTIDNAITTIRNKKCVDWENVAGWDNTMTIRQRLNDLPSREGESSRLPLKFEKAPILKSSRVMLFPMNQRPVAFIDNVPFSRLTIAQYDVITTLLKAGPHGLSKKQLVTRSGHGGAVKILKHLVSSQQLWKNAIDIPGITGGGYRIY